LEKNWRLLEKRGKNELNKRHVENILIFLNMEGAYYFARKHTSNRFHKYMTVKALFWKIKDRNFGDCS
jgi:hypothetical protein